MKRKMLNSHNTGFNNSHSVCMSKGKEWRFLGMNAWTLGFMLWSVVMNFMMVAAYWDRLSPLQKSYKWFFVKTFHVSGFDPLTYNVVTDWGMGFYNIHRHPLLAEMMYPAYLLNKVLTDLTGVNCVQIVVAIILIASSTMAFSFLFRILRDIVGVKSLDAGILSIMNFSFAYVMLASIVPDHFIISMTALLFVLLVSGRKMRKGVTLNIWQTILLFVLTAGISLNNGLKVYIASLFTNGKKIFHPLYLASAVILPAGLLWLFTQFQYEQFVYPDWIAHKKMKERIEKKEDNKAFLKMAENMDVKDTAILNAKKKELLEKRKTERMRKAKSTVAAQHTGRPIKKGEFWNWTDITTSRSDAIVHNLFGESILLHKNYLLEDVLKSRPVIVKYHSWLLYIPSAIIAILLLAGIIAGRKDRFMWTVVSFFALDMMLHLGIGFGINEIYIMSAHWAFVFPITISYLLKNFQGRQLVILRTTLILLTCFLLVYNTELLLSSVYE